MMNGYTPFSYRGLSTDQLDELIYAQNLHGYDGIIKENARLRQENARLAQQGERVDTQTIGQIIHFILDQGFFVHYIFDHWGDMAQVHHFGIWKYHGEEKIAVWFILNDFELRQRLAPKFMDIKEYMKQIDEQLTHRQQCEVRGND